MTDPTHECLLQVEGLCTYFEVGGKTARAVDGISFTVAKGQCVALVGESGCGKSVTSMSIMRLLPTPPARIVQGRILLKGENLLQKSATEMCALRGRTIAMIFQEPQSALNPVFTVGDQLIEAHRVHFPREPLSTAFTKAVESLREVGIPDPERRLQDYPHQLSGGMKQRICIAMALMCDPEVLIADEPTTALDVTIQAQVLELLRKLQREREPERKLGLVLITHDLGVVAEMADRVCVMYGGKIVEDAPVAELFAHPRHPYTQGLMRARPEPGSSLRGRTRLSEIPGRVPPATQYGSDCRFRPRCPLADGTCEKEPALLAVAAGSRHHVACWKVNA